MNTVPAASKLGSFVWGIADLLRGPYKPHQYGGAILPMTILRRLECEIVPPRPPGVGTMPVVDIAAAWYTSGTF